MLVNLTELAVWNAAQERAKDAYHGERALEVYCITDGCMRRRAPRAYECWACQYARRRARKRPGHSGA